MKVAVEIHAVNGPVASMQEFSAVPRIGETIETGNGNFVVHEVRWQPNGVPRVIASPKA